LVKLATTIKDIAGKIKNIAAGINKAILYGIILVSVAVNLANLFLHPKERIVTKFVTQNVLKTVTITNTPPVRYLNGRVVTNTQYITVQEAQDGVNEYKTNSFTNSFNDPYLTVTLPNTVLGDRWEKIKITASDNYRWMYSFQYMIIPLSEIDGSVGYRFIPSIPLFIGVTGGYDPNSKNVQAGIFATLLTK
jgi:hypothetical protein